MMPAENPNKADELLKRYAQKRREQAGDGSLHPANRRILQAAVAKEYPASGQSARAPWLDWLRSWRRSLLLSGATVGAVLALVWVVGEFSGKRPPLQLAKVEEMETRDASVSDRAMDAVSESQTPAGGSGVGGRELKVARLDDAPVALYDSARPQPSLRAANPAPSLAGPAEADTLNRFGSVTATVATPSPSVGLDYSVKLAEADAKSRVVVAAPPAEALEALPLSKQLADARSKAPVTEGYAVNLPKETATPPQSTATKWFGEAAQLGQVAEAKDKAERSSVLSRRSSADGNGPTQLAFRANEPAQSVAATSAAKNETLATQDQPSPLAVVVPAPALTGAVFFRQSDALQSSLAFSVGSFGAQKKQDGESVLGRFTVEQRGAQLRMIEADGSVYEGTIAADAGASRGIDGVSESRARLEKETVTRVGASQARYYSFRAAGTNRTLRQPVVLNGTFVTDEAEADGDAAGVSQPAVPPPAPFRRAIIPAPSINAPASSATDTNQIRLIEGTVRVGPTNEQRFRAVRGSR
jgi:hypothetical protein